MSNTWTLKATFEPTNGAPISYPALTVTVTCTVTSFAAPSNPSDLTYTVFDAAKSFNMNTLTYTQTPDCQYPYTGAYTWSGLPTEGYIAVDSSDSG